MVNTTLIKSFSNKCGFTSGVNFTFDIYRQFNIAFVHVQCSVTSTPPLQANKYTYSQVMFEDITSSSYFGFKPITNKSIFFPFYHCDPADSDKILQSLSSGNLFMWTEGKKLMLGFNGFLGFYKNVSSTIYATYGVDKYFTAFIGKTMSSYMVFPIG